MSARADSGGGRLPRSFSTQGGGRLQSFVRASEEKPADLLATVRRLLAYLAPHRAEVARAMFWVVVSSSASAASPALTGRLVDTALGSRSVAALTVPALMLLATYVVGWWAQRSQILGLGTVGQYALLAVRREILDKVLDLSVAFFDRSDSGDLMSRLVNDVETLNSFLGATFRRAFGATLSVVAVVVGMFVVDARLAGATLLILPVMWVTTWAFSAIARVAFRRTRESIGGVSSTLAEELAGIKESQAFARTRSNRDAFQSRNAANRDANVTASAVSSAFAPALAVISAAAVAAVAVAGGWLSARGLVTIGVVVAFFSYARQFFTGVNQLSSLYAETQSAIAGGERVFALLDTPAEVVDAPDATDMGRASGRIEFEHVSFRYGDGPEVLTDIDLTVNVGETLAIVGPTGAGKSTIVNLVARFYDPTSGVVRLDGSDLRSITTRSLRRNLGIVLQEPFLFSGTIADNIRYGRLDATLDEVRAAAGEARALEFIEDLPDGFDTAVGERGNLLSAGQRQLVAFARAIAVDPAILILDEATSSVDTRTERLIQDGMRAIMAGRTTLVIAHRLSTIREADRIVVVDAGRIVEEGAYDELVAAGGMFSRLHAAQFAD